MRTVLAAWIVVCGLSSMASARTWSDASGKFKVEAELVRVEGEKVTLLRADTGKEIVLTIKQLSAADQKFLKEAAAPDKPAPAKPAAKKTTPPAQALGMRVKAEWKETPLQDVLADLAAQSSSNILIDQRALDEAGVAKETPVTLKADGTLAAILKQLLDPLKLIFVVKHEVILITNSENAWNHFLETRAYRLKPGSDADTVIGQIEQNISPNSWNSVGGPGSCAGLEGGILVLNTFDVQAEIAKQYSNALIPLTAPPEKGVKLVSCEFVNTPLDQAIKELATEAKIKIALDVKGLEAYATAADTPVTLTVRNVSPVSAMSLIIMPLGLTWTRDRGGLLITIHEGPTNPVKAANYDIRGLSTDPAATELLEAVMMTVAPTQWTEVGGPGSMAVKQAGLVTANCQDAVHRELEKLFATMRGK